MKTLLSIILFLVAEAAFGQVLNDIEFKQYDGSRWIWKSLPTSKAAFQAESFPGITDNADANAITIGSDENITMFPGAAGVDYKITLNGETNDGTLTWDEDNARLVLGLGAGAITTTYGGFAVNVQGPAQVAVRNSANVVEGGMFAHPDNFYMGSWTNTALHIRTNNVDKIVVGAAGGADLKVGDMTVTAGVVKIGANQVVGARQTGFTAPTGTSDKGTWDTSSVDVENLAEFVKTLYEALDAHGLID